MSLSIGSIPATTATKSVEPVRASASGGGAVPFSLGATSAGAYMAQGGGAPGEPSGTKSLLAKVLGGAVVGAGLGFGASFITPIINLIPHAKIILPAAGAAIGAIGGLAMHLIGKRKQNLAMQAQAQAAQQQSMQPTVATNGVTLRTGARGAAAAKLQKDLHSLGVYKGTLTGAFDAGTSAAVRRYEVMKGVVPTGLGSPDVRAAVAQDVALMKQYA
ncbi:MAG: putative peptidoglycan binding domain [Thermoleophilia bacterium]|nr:putative peptidoglycan binding domain [Thermoleophilia bacterium]